MEHSKGTNKVVPDLSTSDSTRNSKKPEDLKDVVGMPESETEGRLGAAREDSTPNDVVAGEKYWTGRLPHLDIVPSGFDADEVNVRVVPGPRSTGISVELFVSSLLGSLLFFALLAVIAGWLIVSTLTEQVINR
mmetsp:Transcript_26306/g.66962  ORF Transcript_26306/g.66962 Transcript_26306/m.66962 type:complete len:134 (-) Transcript_26306:236-637(-)